MKSTFKVTVGTAVFVVSLLLPGLLRAQVADATLSGTVTDSSGKAVSSVHVSIKNVDTGQTAETLSNASGIFNVANLAPGNYEVSIAAPGFATKIAKITLTAGTPQTLDLVLSIEPMQPPTPATPENLPNAPSSSRTEPSLSDLGFSPAEAQGNAKEQALLDKRTHMLKVHQRMGLITTIPLLATLITSVNAGGKNTSTASRDLHTALGATTADLYFITAYYAIRAPRIQGTETRGPIRVHKILAWIHGPGMIMTPILGAIAFSQKSHGEKVHGIAQAHGPVAIVTAGAFGAALLSVSLKF